jgi:hypothetical protein
MYWRWQSLPELADLPADWRKNYGAKHAEIRFAPPTLLGFF